MKIIKCSKQNLSSVAAFYDKVTSYLEKHINYPKWIHGEYPGIESARSAIEAGTQYACVDGSEVIGAFILNDNPQGNYSIGNWQTRLKQGEYLVIHALASDPEIYHKGIGRYMVEYCINSARTRGYKAIRLDVVPSNIPARKLYEHMGFQFVCEKDLSRGITDIPVFALYEMNF